MEALFNSAPHISAVGDLGDLKIKQGIKRRWVRNENDPSASKVTLDTKHHSWDPEGPPNGRTSLFVEQRASCCDCEMWTIENLENRDKVVRVPFSRSSIHRIRHKRDGTQTGD